MLGKTKTGRGFKGTVEYCLQDKKDPEILFSNNIANTDKDYIIKEFVCLSSTNDNISKPVWHSSLSFSDQDPVNDEMMVEITNRFMQKAGFNPSNNQWVIIKHNDTNHKHCHIVANRVSFDGKTVSDYYFKSRTVQWSKELEKEFNLTQVQNIAQKNQLTKALSNEKDEIKTIIQNTLENGNIKSFADFQSTLKKQGIDVIVARHKKNGQAYGLSYAKGTKKIKGSDLGKKLAFKTLNSMLPIGIPNPVLQAIKISTKIISNGIELGL